MFQRGVLDHYESGSAAWLVAEPWFTTKIAGKLASVVGEKIGEYLPPGLVVKAEKLTNELIKIFESTDSDPSAHEFPYVLAVISKADEIHNRNLRIIFIEGAVAAGSISLAGAGGPLAGLAVALLEMPLSYALILHRSFEIQRAFHLRPTVERTNRAFAVATAVSRQRRYEACLRQPQSAFEETLARGVIAAHGRGLTSAVKGLVPRAFTGVASRSATGEIVDNGAEEAAKAVVQTGFRAYCQSHPRLTTVMMPVAGALAGGTWAAYSARGVMLASYHLSRLEYIEEVRRRAGFPVAA